MDKDTDKKKDKDTDTDTSMDTDTDLGIGYLCKIYIWRYSLYSAIWITSNTYGASSNGAKNL
jgi:hypothetical protein